MRGFPDVVGGDQITGLFLPPGIVRYFLNGKLIGAPAAGAVSALALIYAAVPCLLKVGAIAALFRFDAAVRRIGSCGQTPLR